MTPIEKLLSISSDGIGEPNPILEGIPSEISNVLLHRNGFYAFESALLFRPSGSLEKPINSLQWNVQSSWKYLFECTSIGYCFAENIFGEQYYIHNENIYQFDPETCETKIIANNLNEWAELILDDYDYLTGYPLAHEWQAVHGPIPRGSKLVPKLAFVLGGEFSIENLVLSPELDVMRLRAAIANQIQDVEDGQSIYIETKK
jgi:hypothetical protein